MSDSLPSIHRTGRNRDRDLQILRMGGPDGGLMLQLTQGTGAKTGPDEPGYIELTRHDAERLNMFLTAWTTEEEG